DAADAAPPLRVRGVLVSPKRASLSTAPAESISNPPMVAPTNDTCGGAAVIPAAGPFPYLSSTYDITDATTTGDPPTPSCQPNISRSIWFKFTPSAAGLYTFSLCNDAPTNTNLEDTVLAIYTATGSCTGLSELVGGCDDDSCSVGELESVLSNMSL